MQRPTSLFLTIILLTGALAGCVGDDNGTNDGQQDTSPTLSVEKLSGGSEYTEAQITAVTGDMTYDDLVVSVNGNPYSFAQQANYDERRYSVAGVPTATADVAESHRIRIPAAGLVDVELRDGNTGAVLASYSTTVADDTAPRSPSNLAPEDGSQAVSRTPVFRWSPVVDPSGVTYHLEVSLDPNFQAPLIVERQEHIGANNFALGDGEELAPGQTYYWHVQPVDGNGNEGPWSVTWSFTTKTLE